MKSSNAKFNHGSPTLFEFAAAAATAAATTLITRLGHATATIAKRFTTGVFDPWTPLLRFAGARPHGVPLIESAALAAITPPLPTYQPMLDGTLVSSGALSEAQLEAVTLIGQAHDEVITIGRDYRTWAPIRARRGFKLGAGTGTGKTRILLASIIDNANHGRTKAVFVTQNADLLDNVRRDYASLDKDPNEIVSLSKWSIDEPVALESGVLFVTYALFRAERLKGQTRLRRINQIIAWLTDCSDAIFVFDESQNLGNAAHSLAGTGSPDEFAKGSKQGVAAIELQDRMPNLRIIYSSATSDDHVNSLAYAPRLGLFGPDTAFRTRNLFLQSMQRAGIAAMEVVCQDLKARGLYWAPQLSATGITTESLVHALSPSEIKALDGFSAMWRVVETTMNQALLVSRAAVHSGSGRILKPIPGSNAGHARLSYAGTMQRFYQLAYMSLKMPTVIEHMRDRLAAGEACVLQCHNTFESSQREALADAGTNNLDTIDVSPRRLLLKWVEEHFPTTDFETFRVKGILRAKERRDPLTGDIIKNRQACSLRDELYEHISTIILPDNPLDILLDAFGPDAIAEVTGRQHRLIRTVVKGNAVRTLQPRSRRDVDRDIAAFFNDEKQVLIFSEARGGVGQSYHADLSRKNHRKRNHYLLQVSWRAIDALQGLGRSHRTNQACPPHYILTTTSVPAENRFVSTIAKRMGELGALTQGNRDADGSKLINQSMSLEN